MKIYIVKLEEYEHVETLGIYTAWSDIVNDYQGNSWTRDARPFIEVWDLNADCTKPQKQVGMEVNRTLHVLNESYSLTVVPND